MSDDGAVIPVGETAAGATATAPAGQRVELPVVELLTGRGFITGKSGSGKSNTASVIAERLLDAGHPLLIVDTDGEYYGLKEAYELLHVGADDECDIRVGPEHADRIVDLALEEGVPIVLDVSGFLDESQARDLITAIAKGLFAKAKKLKRPFLLLVEEVHEYVPEAGLDECGQALVKVGKRGRKHGLGIAGISQRPADVKKDFITQCDWLCWHRLTWRNDTRVVKRVLGGEYAEAVEDLDDGEAFLRTDWAGEVQRVQFDRKATFDAGATPGLGDFERPELKSVSDDLVAELERVSDRQERRQDRIERLQSELDAKEAEIERLEAELAEARDLSRMAEQFVEALERDRSVTEADGRGEGSLPADVDPADAPQTDTTGTEHQGSTQPESLSASAPTATETVTDGARRSHSTEAEDDQPVLELPDPQGHDDAPAAEPTPPERRLDQTSRELRATVESLPAVARRMLAHYRESGPCGPRDAYLAAGGDGDRPDAYRFNGRLREAGLIHHAGRGMYSYALARRLRRSVADDVEPPPETLRRAVRRVEQAIPELI